MRTTLAVFLLLCSNPLQAAAESSALPRSTPEAQGIPSSAILAFVEAAEETVLVARIEGQERRWTCGHGEWRRGGPLLYRDRLIDNAEEPVAASGAWTSDTTYTVKLCLYETPFCARLNLEFAGDVLLFDQEMNVAFGETKRPQLVGRLPQQVRKRRPPARR